MDSSHHPQRPATDPHFERLHGPPLRYARSIQSFLQIHDSGTMDYPVEAGGFSCPTVPKTVDFAKGKAQASDMPPPPTAGFGSGFQTPYEDTCSIVNCGSGCNPSVLGSKTCSLSQCNNLDNCTSDECCRESGCPDHSSLPTTRRDSIDLSAGEQLNSSSSWHDVANNGAVFPPYDNVPGFNNIDDDSLQCHWLLPDQECDITAPTNVALSQHVFHDHIQPETSLTCAWRDCEEQVKAQHFNNHMWNSHPPGQHAPDSYICLWDGCLKFFFDAEELEMHMEVTHIQMESIECRWGGCDIITANPAELQGHVNKEHLHLYIHSAVSSPRQEMAVSDNRIPCQPYRPFYWTPENDNLLLRVRAQNLTFPQIARQYFPDKSARACQDRYARLYYQEENYVPQPIEQSTTPLYPTPMQPASDITSSYESRYPLVRPPWMRASSFVLSNHSIQPVPDNPPGNHKCMWIEDETTQALCEARLEAANELQAHVESSHYPLSENRKRRPASHWVCKWMGCALKGEKRGSRDKLRKHICTHTGHYPLSCRHCNKRFRDETKLADHERTHTGEKPHKCDVCEMAFTTRDGRSTHNRIHTGEKPLECGKCSYTCSDPSNMAKHRKAHEPPLYSCPTCGKQFCRADSRDRHMRLHEIGNAGRKRVHGEVA